MALHIAETHYRPEWYIGPYGHGLYGRAYSLAFAGALDRNRQPGAMFGQLCDRDLQSVMEEVGEMLQPLAIEPFTNDQRGDRVTAAFKTALCLRLLGGVAEQFDAMRDTRSPGSYALLVNDVLDELTSEAVSADIDRQVAQLTQAAGKLCAAQTDQSPAFWQEVRQHLTQAGYKEEAGTTNFGQQFLTTVLSAHPPLSNRGSQGASALSSSLEGLPIQEPGRQVRQIENIEG